MPANNCFLVPESVSGQDAVALPANYLTAYLSIFTMGNIQPGDTVLIHSIAGIMDFKIEISLCIMCMIICIYIKKK